MIWTAIVTSLLFSTECELSSLSPPFNIVVQRPFFGERNSSRTLAVFVRPHRDRFQTVYCTSCFTCSRSCAFLWRPLFCIHIRYLQPIFNLASVGRRKAMKKAMMVMVMMMMMMLLLGMDERASSTLWGIPKTIVPSLFCSLRSLLCQAIRTT